MTFSLAYELEQLDASERQKVAERVELVHNAQRRLGMEPRDDSRLTFQYGCDMLDEDVPSVIANELVIVNNIFKNTNYSAIIEDVLRELAHYMKRTYHLTWNDAWDIVKFYGPTMLKLYCVRNPKVASESEAHPVLNQVSTTPD